MLETVPVFLATNLDVAATRRLASLQRELAAHPAAVRQGLSWTSPANLRVVLRFLGAADPALAPALLDPLRELAGAAQPARVQLGSVVPFPSPDQARLITLQVLDPSNALAELSAHVESLLSSLGFAPPRHPFSPHVTLARTEAPIDTIAWLGGLAPLAFDARLSEVVLYRHAQSRPGAEHSAVDRFALAPLPRASQRPSKAPKPSQRPSKRPKPEAAAQKLDIPAPPRVPSIPMPGAAPVAHPPAVVPEAASPPRPPAPEPAPPPPSPAPPQAPPPDKRASILPPGVEAQLPSDDEWG